MGPPQQSPFLRPRVFWMTTLLARTMTQPSTSSPLITVPDWVMVMAPDGRNVTPAGTPVLLASGHADGAGGGAGLVAGGDGGTDWVSGAGCGGGVDAGCDDDGGGGAVVVDFG